MKDHISEIENLVFQGGGVRGIAYLGAIQALCDEKLLKHQRLNLEKIKRVGGTSAGAMTAFHIALGKNVSELNGLRGLDFFNDLLDDDIIERNKWLRIPQAPDYDPSFPEYEDNHPPRRKDVVKIFFGLFTKKKLFYSEDIFLDYPGKPITTMGLLALLSLKMGEHYAKYIRRPIPDEEKKEEKSDPTLLKQSLLELLIIPLLKELGIILFNNYGHELFDSIIKMSSLDSVIGGIKLRDIQNEVQKKFGGEREFDSHCELLFALLLHVYKQKGTSVGIFSGRKLQEKLQSDLEDADMSPTTTFREWNDMKKHRKNLKDLHVVALDMHTKLTTVFSYDETPDVVVVDAVRASMSIPIFFQPPKIRIKDGLEINYLESVFIDGGIFDNYPIWLFDKVKYTNDSNDPTPIYNKKTLGMRLVTAEEKYLYESRFSDPREIKLPIPSAQDGFFKPLLSCLMAWNKQNSDHYHGSDPLRTIYISTGRPYSLALISVETPEINVESILRQHPGLNPLRREGVHYLHRGEGPLLIEQGPNIYVYGSVSGELKLTQLDASHFSGLSFKKEPELSWPHEWKLGEEKIYKIYREIAFKRGHVANDIHTVEFNLSEVQDTLINSGKEGVLHFLNRSHDFLNERRLQLQSSSSSPTPTRSYVPPPSSNPQLLAGQLVTACERGDSKRVQYLIAQGASPDMRDEKGKLPLGAAVWGMNPKVINILLKEKASMSWEECEQHNRKWYKEIFIVEKFAPLTIDDWWRLIQKIDDYPFVNGYHLEKVDEAWSDSGKEIGEWGKLRHFVEYAYSKSRGCLWYVAVDGHRFGMNRGSARFGSYERDFLVERTEAGYVGYRTQIQQVIAKASHLRVGKEKRSQPEGELGRESSTASLSSSSSVILFPLPLDEKRQGELIKTCKAGDVKSVQLLLSKGARADLATRRGEYPLGAAVWGMNPEVVSILLEEMRITGKVPMTWEKCEEHNNKFYNEKWIVDKFVLTTYDEWYRLIEKIEPSLFLRTHHLKCVTQAGYQKVEVSSWENWKKYVENLKKTYGSKTIKEVGWQEYGLTNQGCVNYQAQIQQAITTASRLTCRKRETTPTSMSVTGL